MVLGARTKDDRGCVLVYTSRDLEDWNYATRIEPVSYTHLDVYKRQEQADRRSCRIPEDAFVVTNRRSHVGQKAER